MNRLRYVLLLLPLAALAVWSYLYAYDRQVWWTEMSTVFLPVPLYLWLDASGRCRLYLLACRCCSCGSICRWWVTVTLLNACRSIS